MEDNKDIWSNAKWIAFEQLPESMKVVPGMHVLESHLDHQPRNRSIIPMLRKDFTLYNTVKNASINICGLGHYELHLNGKKIDDRFLSPGWTNYKNRQLYNTYDITEQIHSGANAIGVIVGNGFYYINNERYFKLSTAYGYPKLVFNIRVEYEDGSIENFVSNENCKVTPSPITFSSIYGGEDYDATLEQPGWDCSGFDDSKWQKPVLIDDSLDGLVLEEDYPIKVMDEFNVQNIMKSKTGRTIYDFGQNASGIISLKVKGNKGAQIKIQPDEILNGDLNITQISGGGPYEFNYTLNGKRVEVWQPRFTYYGFRYADVEIIEPANAKIKTEIVELKMLHTRNSAPIVGTFHCSDILFNKIYELINWGIKSNMASVATDCPHREKLGWLEQTYLIGPSMHYIYDMHAFYKKIVNDIIDSQLENGLVPNIVPEYVSFDDGFRDSPEWGSASIIIPWQLYKWYGDTEVLELAYPTMIRYADYLDRKSKNSILDYGLGDWFDLGPKQPGEAQLTPKSLTATALYYYDLQILTKVAKLINNDADIEKYSKLAEKVKTAFHKKFYNFKTGVCSTGSQTSYAMTLFTGIVPEQEKEKVYNNLIESIEKNNYELTSGDIGFHFLVRVLFINGRSDILYKMNNRSDRPGYGYQLKKGATALTESWAALSNVSNNHMMLGHLMEWFYAGLGGIYQDDYSFAYRDIIIAPKPVGNISWVKCSFKSPQGIIVSEWEVKENMFSLIIEVPKSTSAKIIVPDEYNNSSIEIFDLINQESVVTKIEEGVFKIKHGRYKIIAR
ncbi:MAG: family 78 glycoside hydrolase catalytic domain [Bacteroidota bacterium]